MHKTRYFIGTSGWTYADWRGAFYPQHLSQRHWLEFYTSQFNTVEINATFYRFFNDTTFLKWYERAPSDFRYVVKVPRIITHRYLLKNCGALIQQFSESAQLLKDKLGAMLLQLAPNTPYDLERLKAALEQFPDPTKVVVEFRHAKWLTNETKALLKALGCVFCAVDSPESKLLPWITGRIAYVRLHGRDKWYDYNYSEKELCDLVTFLKNMEGRVDQVYVFFNNDHHAYAVKNALRLRKLMKQY